MELIYNVALSVICVLLFVTIVISVWIYFHFYNLEKDTPTLCCCDLNRVRSSESLSEELEIELKHATTRYKLHRLIYYFLSLISIIGGIVVSTMYFQVTFPKQVGSVGFVILLSSIFTLFYRPAEKYKRAREDTAFLKSAKRHYLRVSGIDVSKANELLERKLAEYDRKHCMIDL